MALKQIEEPRARDMCTNPHCRKRIRQLEEELHRVKSVGYDMLKQRGGWQAGGKTPSDLSLEFNDFFDHEVDDFSKSLIKYEKIEEDKARQLACSEFQALNNLIQSIVLNRLADTLSRVFIISSAEECNEQLYDICRAYGLLLNASGLAAQPIAEQMSAEATSLLSKTYPSMPLSETRVFATKSALLLWNLVTTIPPLLSCTPSSAYFKEWHEKELSPTWNKSLINYKLVYYRPILFMSCDGTVARKGWVGNEEGCKNSSVTKQSSSIENDAKETSTSGRIFPTHKTIDSLSSKIASTLMPNPCDTKYPYAISYSRLKSDKDEPPLPEDPPVDTASKFYHQNIDVDVSGLRNKSQSKKVQTSWKNWSTQRRLM